MPTNTHGHWVVEPNLTPADRAPGVSNSRTVSEAFPGSPIHNGELTDEVVIEQAQRLLTVGVVEDDGVYGSVDRDYSGEGDAPGAPNISEEEITRDSRGHDLSSPYAPSLASPPGGADDWANQPATPEQTRRAGRGSLAPFEGNGLASPAPASANIAAQTIGSLRKGTSF